MNPLRSHSAAVKMSYRIEGMYSPYRHIEIVFSDSGEGQLRYRLYREYISPGKEAEGIIPLALAPSAIAELSHLYDAADFFNVDLTDAASDEPYPTDVGTTMITYRHDGRERYVSYRHVKDNPLKGLVSFYESLAKQHLPPVYAPEETR